MKPKVRARDSSRRKFCAVDVKLADLMSDQRMIEIDLDVEPETVVVRQQFAHGAVAHHAHRLENLDVLAGRIERNDAGLINGGDEGVGAAVHDRHFRAIDFDDRVVDAERIKRCHDVFRGRAQRTIAVAEHRCKFSGCYRAHVGADFARRFARLPVRMNTMPVPASAGRIVSVTGAPECTPIPTTETSSQIVVCRVESFAAIELAARFCTVMPTSVRVVTRMSRCAVQPRRVKPTNDPKPPILNCALRPPKAAILLDTNFTWSASPVTVAGDLKPLSPATFPKAVTDQKPLRNEHLTQAPGRGNSRFFTDCYHRMALLWPNPVIVCTIFTHC